MRIQLETIKREVQGSFDIMYNPRLNDLFFWHFHPEYELVYIQGASGTRHVGEHISNYDKSDLVLIGSNIPHLNFDYNVKTDYQKVVVHIQPNFVQDIVNKVPEMESLATLFRQSTYGLAFMGESKIKIGRALFDLENQSRLEQYLALIRILGDLSAWGDVLQLHEHPYVNRYRRREQDRIRAIHAFIDQNYSQRIELEAISDVANMTKEAFCRYFKRATGKSFVEFLNAYRVSQAKRMLMNGETVSEACYSSGFSSLSYFNRVFKKTTQENPRDFRNKYV